MRAELAALSSGRQRWAFAVGCLRTSMAQPYAPAQLGYPVLMAAILGAAVMQTNGIRYLLLRWGVVAAVAILVLVSWWGRRPGLLGPVAPHPAARLVRLGGCLLVGGLGVAFVIGAGTHGPPDQQATGGLPFVTAFMLSYLVGFLALTAERYAPTVRVLAAGVGAGICMVALWLLSVLAWPPIPADAGLALLVTAAGMTVAAWLNAGRRGGPENALLAAVCAGTVTQLLIFAAVGLLSSFGPARLIPDLVPAAVSAADDLENSRIEVNDPYVALLFLACLFAIALTATSIITRRDAAQEAVQRTPAR